MPNVDLSDLSHSYPFLHLSQKYKVPYQKVLEIADLIDGYQPSSTLADSAPLLYHDVYLVCKAPWRWDMSRAGEKGL